MKVGIVTHTAMQRGEKQQRALAAFGGVQAQQA